MDEPRPADPAPISRLDRISTQWPLLPDPARFVLRYGLAVRRYIEALVHDANDAEEVAQEFMLRVVQHGFLRASPDRGRFRDYLKTAVRNATLTWLERRRARPRGGVDLLQIPAPDAAVPEADEAWQAEWRRCLLDRAWRALDVHERASPGNLFHTVLRAATDRPHVDSETLAAEVAHATGRPLRADAFRKQLSRARHLFAESLVAEVAETLADATPERLEEELIALGLMSFVRDFLPPDWRTRGRLAAPE